MASIILALVLFVAVSVVIYLYTAWMPVSSGAPKDIPADLDPQEAFRLLSELFILTPKETEVFDKLVNSEVTSWSIQRKVFRRLQMDCIYPGEPVSGISRRSMRKQV